MDKKADASLQKLGGLIQEESPRKGGLDPKNLGEEMHGEPVRLVRREEGKIKHGGMRGEIFFIGPSWNHKSAVHCCLDRGRATHACHCRTSWWIQASTSWS